MPKPAYQEIAKALEARDNCLAKTPVNMEWAERWEAYTKRIAGEYFPSGSGFDNGTKLLDDSTPEWLAFEADFHHMDENGGYVGWTEHYVYVTPSPSHGFDIRVTGKNENDIKNYIAEEFEQALRSEVTFNP